MIGNILKYTFWSVFISVLFVNMPGIPPDAKFTNVSLVPTRSLQNIAVHQESLNNVKKIFPNQFIGPECLAIYNGELYFTTFGNRVFKMTPSQELKLVTVIGNACDNSWQEPLCGRALGLRIDKSGKMYVLHTQHGVWRYDLESTKKELLISPSTPIDGILPRLYNSISLASNGDFYWSHSSSLFDLENGAMEFLVDGTGRLLHYNAATKENKVILTGLGFANGVAISPDEDFVVVAETAYLRMRKVYVKGPKKGQQDIFIEGLPGCPDNVQTLPDGSGILVSLILAEGAQDTIIFKNLAKMPYVRKFVARTLAVIEGAFVFLNKNFPHVIFERVINKVGGFEFFSLFLTETTALMKVDWNGNVVDLWYCSDKSIMVMTDAIVFDGKLYLGSLMNNYLGVVDAPPSLKSSFEQKKTGKATTPSESKIKVNKVE